MSAARNETRHRPAGLWAGLMMASVAAIAGLRISGAIDPTTGFILLAASFSLMIPFAKAINRRGACGVSTAAIRYNKGVLIAGFAYAMGLGIAVRIDDQMELTDGTMFLVALLPVVPIFWMIYVMGRYVLEEQDEYLRHRAVNASLIGLGAVLAIGSFWGFLETFELVPHMPGWLAVPIWAVGMGLGQGWMGLRNRAADSE